MPIVAKAIEDLAGRAPGEAALRTAMGVETTYLDTAFGAIEERFGGIDAYLENALGITAALRRTLEARLLD